MADHYKLETKGGRIWLDNAKNQVDQSTRIVSKERVKEPTKFEGEPCLCIYILVKTFVFLFLGGKFHVL